MLLLLLLLLMMILSDVIVIFVDCYDNDKKYQARCEKWEKEAASTNATADHLEDQVLSVYVMMILCTVIINIIIMRIQQ